MAQFLKCGDQIGQRTAPAIQSPYQHDIDLAPASSLQQFLASLPLRRTGANLTHLHRNRPAATRCVFAKSAILHGKGLLVVRGHAGIEANPKHFHRF
jgi:hypothetical protein